RLPIWSLEGAINYAKVCKMAPSLLASAQSRAPIVGKREGIETLEQIAASVERFQKIEIPVIQARLSDADGLHRPIDHIDFGTLGDITTLEQLRTAYLDGEEQVDRQKTIIMTAVGIVVLLVGSSVLVLFRKKSLDRDSNLKIT